MGHQSDSSIQSNAEAVIRDRLSERLGVALAPARIEMPGGAEVHVDAVAIDRSVFAEIFARQGKLKPGQQKKVAIDALKLITLGRTHPDAKLVVAFCDPEASVYATGKGWLARALAEWQVQVTVLEVDEATRAAIRASQQRQVMVNPDDEPEATAEVAPPAP